MKKNLVLLLAFLAISFGSFAQRTVTGTCYEDGKPASGVTVTAQKSKSSMMTGFDGKYEIEISEKTKYIQFEYPAEIYKLDVEGKSESVFDYFVGEKPNLSSTGVIVDERTHDELVKANVKDYLVQLNIYVGLYNAKSYVKALPKWKALVAKYPNSQEQLYIHGINIHEAMLKSATTPAEKKSELEEMLKLYDYRGEKYGSKMLMSSLKVQKIMQYSLNVNSTDAERLAVNKEVYSMLSEAIANSKEAVSAPILVQQFKLAVALYKLDGFAADKLIMLYDETSASIQAKIDTNAEDEGVYLSRRGLDVLFEVSGAANCETLISMYKPKLDADPSNVDLLKKMMRLLSRNECTDSDLFVEGSEKLYAIAPTAQSAFQMAQRFVKQNDLTKAIEYYKESISMCGEDFEMEAKANYGLASVYLQKKSLSAARTHAKRSVALLPDFGRGYMMIAYIYQSAKNSFGEDDFDKKSVYWIVADYFNKAAQADENVRAEARAKARSFRQYFPTTEDCFFFRNITKGAKYTVGGWIGETTTVRTSD